MGDRYDCEFFRTDLREPGILWLTLDRPERRNAITPQMHAEPAPLFSRIGDPHVSAGIVANRLLDTSLALEALTFETADHREAARAFLEKRPAVFGKGS